MPAVRATNPQERPDSFRSAFMGTLKREGEGLLTPYLFYDSPEPTKLLPAKALARRSRNRILSGSRAWDAHVHDSESYTFPDGDIAALQAAVENGLIDALPEKLAIFEYGPGGNSGVRKPIELIKALRKAGCTVEHYTAIDILARYAKESARSIRRKFDNIDARSLTKDFMSREQIRFPKKKLTDRIPLVAIFGGAIANAPDYSRSGGRNSKQNAATYFSMMQKVHGPDVHILMTYETSDSPETLMKSYAATPEFSAFVLSGFARAVTEGVITDNHYDPSAYWKMEPQYDAEHKVVKLCAVCTASHSLSTVEGPIAVKKDDKFVNILSHKWDEADYESILSDAGYDSIRIYKEQGHTAGVLLVLIPKFPRIASLPKPSHN